MRSSLLALVVIATMVGPGSALAQEESGPNFTGTWVLNQDLSDSFQPQRHPGGSPQSGMRGGGGRGGGMKQSRTGQQPSPGDPPKVARIQQEISRLEIFHAGPELNITSGLDISRLFFTDGRTTTVMGERGPATATAMWQDATLKIQWQTDQDAPGRWQSFALADDGQRLTVTETRPGPQSDKSQKMKLVYDKQE